MFVGTCLLYTSEYKREKTQEKTYIQEKQVREAPAKYARRDPNVNRAAVNKYKKHPEVSKRAVKKYAKNNPHVNQVVVTNYQKRYYRYNYCLGEFKIYHFTSITHKLTMLGERQLILELSQFIPGAMPRI